MTASLAFIRACDALIAWLFTWGSIESKCEMILSRLMFRTRITLVFIMHLYPKNPHFPGRIPGSPDDWERHPLSRGGFGNFVNGWDQHYI